MDKRSNLRQLQGAERAVRRAAESQSGQTESVRPDRTARSSTHELVRTQQLEVAGDASVVAKHPERGGGGSNEHFVLRVACYGEGQRVVLHGLPNGWFAQVDSERGVAQTALELQ